MKCHKRAVLGEFRDIVGHKGKGKKPDISCGIVSHHVWAWPLIL